jgi:hypothetical protein
MRLPNSADDLAHAAGFPCSSVPSEAEIPVEDLRAGDEAEEFFNRLELVRDEFEGRFDLIEGRVRPRL